MKKVFEVAHKKNVCIATIVAYSCFQIFAYPASADQRSQVCNLLKQGYSPSTSDSFFSIPVSALNTLSDSGFTKLARLGYPLGNAHRSAESSHVIDLVGKLQTNAASVENADYVNVFVSQSGANTTSVLEFPQGNRYCAPTFIAVEGVQGHVAVSSILPETLCLQSPLSVFKNRDQITIISSTQLTFGTGEEFALSSASELRFAQELTSIDVGTDNLPPSLDTPSCVVELPSRPVGISGSNDVLSRLQFGDGTRASSDADNVTPTVAIWSLKASSFSNLPAVGILKPQPGISSNWALLDFSGEPPKFAGFPIRKYQPLPHESSIAERLSVYARQGEDSSLAKLQLDKAEAVCLSSVRRSSINSNLQVDLYCTDADSPQINKQSYSSITLSIK